jgi:hypothetical protein
LAVLLSRVSWLANPILSDSQENRRSSTFDYAGDTLLARRANPYGRGKAAQQIKEAIYG